MREINAVDNGQTMKRTVGRITLLQGWQQSGEYLASLTLREIKARIKEAMA